MFFRVTRSHQDYFSILFYRVVFSFLVLKVGFIDCHSPKEDIKDCETETMRISPASCAIFLSVYAVCVLPSHSFCLNPTSSLSRAHEKSNAVTSLSSEPNGASEVSPFTEVSRSYFFHPSNSLFNNRFQKKLLVVLVH